MTGERTTQSLRAARDALIARDGPWTGAAMALPGGLVTRDGVAPGDHNMRRVVQIVADLAPKPLDQLRLLDLACFEGQFAIEFALHGCDVVGIEGREVNIEKARFTARAHGLERIELVRDDVRSLTRERFGGFDVVLCLGLLYHLDFPDVMRFLERIGEVCDGLAVVDTHVAIGRARGFPDGQHSYHGRSFFEHRPRASTGERQRSLWASLDNENSFWFTRSSLLNAFVDVGFTSAYDCDVPPEPDKRSDRRTFVAIKGTRVELRSAPEFSQREWERVPEHRPRALWRNHLPGTNLLKRVAHDVRALIRSR